MKKNSIGPSNGTNEISTHINLSVGDLNSVLRIMTMAINQSSGAPTGIR